MRVPYIDYRDSTPGALLEIVVSTLFNEGVLIIRNFPDAEDDHSLLAFGESLGTLRPHFSRRTAAFKTTHPNDYVTLVEPTSKGLHNQHGQQILSQTHLPFPCHTDEYFLQHPSNIVMLLCCRPDPLSGGCTLLAHVEEIVKVLSTAALHTLQLCSFPHPDGSTAILSFWRQRWHIRYNRQYINGLSKDMTHSVDPSAAAALASLDIAIAGVCAAVSLKGNDCLVLHNERVLHGREGFTPSSHRRFKRLRVQRDGLEFAN
jgi:alpha-ketoglutarate-dependent taurine dioxygenase